MHDQIECRELCETEIEKLAALDRTETVERVFHIENGELTLKEKHCEIRDWSPEKKRKRVDRITTRCRSGAASAFGAFCDGKLVGIAVVDLNPMESRRELRNLSGLWVSNGYRKIGVGRALVDLAKRKVQQVNGRGLYVSATPSENTVKFYRSAGFALATIVDREMYEREPDDIHMEMPLPGPGEADGKA